MWCWGDICRKCWLGLENSSFISIKFSQHCLHFCKIEGLIPSVLLPWWWSLLHFLGYYKWGLGSPWQYASKLIALPHNIITVASGILGRWKFISGSHKRLRGDMHLYMLADGQCLMKASVTGVIGEQIVGTLILWWPFAYSTNMCTILCSTSSNL